MSFPFESSASCALQGAQRGQRKAAVGPELLTSLLERLDCFCQLHGIPHTASEDNTACAGQPLQPPAQPATCTLASLCMQMVPALWRPRCEQFGCSSFLSDNSCGTFSCSQAWLVLNVVAWPRSAPRMLAARASRAIRIGLAGCTPSAPSGCVVRRLSCCPHGFMRINGYRGNLQKERTQDPAATLTRALSRSNVLL